MCGLQLCADLLLLVLVFLPSGLGLGASTTHTSPHIQTIESWCTSSNDEHRMRFDPPKAKCNRSAFLEENDVSAYQPIALTERDFVNCSYSDLGLDHVYQTLEASLTFALLGLQQVGQVGGDWCTFGIEAPDAMVFKILPENRSSWRNGELLEKHSVYDGDGNEIASLLDIKHRGGIYYSSGSYVYFRLPKNATGRVEYQLSFQAVLDCTNQLEVYCSADNEGFIQTPGWDGVTNYPNDVNSCVTLVVPDGYTTMISLVSFELETTSDCFYDSLNLYMSRDCTGNEEKICTITDLYPTTYDNVKAISFLFESDSSITKSGFRLLYSFHPYTARPEKLPGGKWNCSVPFYSDFQQHFQCSSDVFCLDGQDKEGCNTGTLCVQDIVDLGDKCYRRIHPAVPYTWEEAAHTCESFRAHLIHLKNAKEWRDLAKIANSSLLDTNTFVGLRLSPPTAPELYQSSWLWSDETLAIYLAIDSTSSMSPPYCAMIHVGSDQVLSVVTCDLKVNGSFLCELEDWSANDGEEEPVQFPTLTSWTLQPMMARCDFNHTTHAFLACDLKANCSAQDLASSIFCAENRFWPAVPFYTCRNEVERVPYSLVCDHRSDCCDSSDEDFCQFPACLKRKEFACKNKKQCIPREQRCDNRLQCVDESDEFKCSAALQDTLVPFTLPPPALVQFTGRGNFFVLPLDNASCPETHFQCPGDGYCLPVFVRCNDVYDCPGREDEADCDSYTCPGFYRCRDSRICLHNDYLCDNVSQCPQHDDELMCNFTCPAACTCYGHAFICSDIFPAHQYPDLRYLEASGTGMTLEEVSVNRLLIHLSLQRCGISGIGRLDLPNLQSLDLSRNKISVVTSNELSQLKNLLYFSLAYNPVTSWEALFNTQHVFPLIRGVQFSGLDIQELHERFFVAFPSISHLNLSGNGLNKLPETGFEALKELRVLDLRECPLKRIFPGVFDGLEKLELVYTDNYKLCCPSVLPANFDPKNCHAPIDEVSSCDALLRSEAFRVFLAVYALLSLIGNLGSFVHRSFFEKASVRMGYDVFVTHLCVSDFLMGVYLAIIGVADRVYYDYRWNDTAWTHSAACKVAGFLSLLSSEVSAFLICFITLERFLVIGFPYKNLRFRRWSAHVACVNLWIIGMLLAAVPLLPSTAHWEFYSQSGICIPLPITRKDFAGSDYSFYVMIVLNFVLFVLIAVGQLLIYWSIRVNSIPSHDTYRRSKDAAVARRLLAIVMTDFLCWFPIGLLGLLAKVGVPVPGDVKVAMAIFVIPFNSALNPFLYTFNKAMVRRRKSQMSRQRSTIYSTRNSVADTERNRTAYTEEEAWKLFNKFLTDGVLSPDRVRRRVIDIEYVSN